MGYLQPFFLSKVGTVNSISGEIEHRQPSDNWFFCFRDQMEKSKVSAQMGKLNMIKFKLHLFQNFSEINRCIYLEDEWEEGLDRLNDVLNQQMAVHLTIGLIHGTRFPILVTMAGMGDDGFPIKRSMHNKSKTSMKEGQS